MEGPLAIGALVLAVALFMTGLKVGCVVGREDAHEDECRRRCAPALYHQHHEDKDGAPVCSCATVTEMKP